MVRSHLSVIVDEGLGDETQDISFMRRILYNRCMVNLHTDGNLNLVCCEPIYYWGIEINSLDKVDTRVILYHA